MWAIFRKELQTYFGSVYAYLVAIVFVIMSALFLWFLDTDYNIFNIGNANIKSFFHLAPWLWMFLVPALAMRSFAEECTQGTLQWLFSKPIRLPAIIGAKFWALVLVLLFCLVPSLIFVYSISKLSLPEGNIDGGVIQGGYMGLLLLGLGYIAIGIWASCLTKNMVYAYLLSLFLNFSLYFGLEKIASFDNFGSLDFLIKKLGFSNHYEPFINGLVDSRDVFYFVAVITVFLGLTYYSLQNQK